MASNTDNEIPQWKKDLIARLRNQNKQTSIVATGGGKQQLYTGPPQSSSTAVGRAGQQPSLKCNTSESVASASIGTSVSGKCNVLSPTCSTNKMVQERVWVDTDKYDDFKMVSEKIGNGYQKDADSDSSEDLHYGPGIVNKLKNKYQSLALRENNARVRPSILHMRKATSLENMLDDDVVPNGTISRGNRLFETRLNGSNDTGKNVPNRYRAARTGELKRARSVETISIGDNHINLIDVKPMRESLHEEMLITEKEGNDKPHRKMHDNNKPLENNEHKFSNNYGHRINRPKRIAPIMNEREKPPADVVKQAKLIFERRPEQRTKPPLTTGEVAAKVDSFNNIIVKSKALTKKPPILKHKPVLNDKDKCNTQTKITKPTKIKDYNKTEPPKNLELNKVPKSTYLEEQQTLTSPIPDISRIDFHKNGENECGFNKVVSNLSETPDLILTSSPLPALNLKNPSEKFIIEEIRHSSQKPEKLFSSQLSQCEIEDEPDNPEIKLLSPKSQSNIRKAGNCTTFNFVNQNIPPSHLPTINQNISNTKTPPSQPLKLEINGVTNTESKRKTSPRLLQQTTDNEQSPKSPPNVVKEPAKLNLTDTEIQNNLKNTVKTLQQPKPSASVSVEVNKIVVPKPKRTTQSPPTNSQQIFDFTSRKDVPDYISNDRSRSPGRPDLPKPGEGGIILIPGASIGESFTDEEEELLKSLEGPPSPCDVTFINDNILIDGKSSLSQKSKKASKMKISFIEAGPEIYEYPSETSLLLDDSPMSPVNNGSVGKTVPNLAGSTLANYTPKSTEDFQPGVTRSIQNIPTKPEEIAPSEPLVQELDQPILFSAGTNSDILF